MRKTFQVPANKSVLTDEPITLVGTLLGYSDSDQSILALNATGNVIVQTTPQATGQSGMVYCPLPNIKLPANSLLKNAGGIDLWVFNSSGD